ncbi:RNA polymerase factor sigma-54 [Caloramator sp. Dgby_cultured_2]|uniref:RNA polymerase factor sigma-54 n=1 Tax=Caloramator sp. Dgby_cultured_2 TaxID=3029174 RepID=UPI00237D478A|nr:RNA polymerase factor sigma-54 [Caloramator sp. Dgby_cultured_2]WDU83809.1 RNA polymerase factor sigma-54 [Caloramator sp. Dgby_cultured_2]
MLQFDLNLKMENKLILTQDMNLSLKILQMNVLDLEKYVYEEIEVNPLLDIDEEEDKKFIQLMSYDESISYRENSDENIQKEFIENKELILRDILLEQLRLLKLDNKKYRIGKYIIDNLDEAGYLMLSIDDLAKELRVRTEEVKELIRTIQTFEPYGVCARDLKECLKIQLINSGCADDIIIKLIEEHLEDVGKLNYTKLSKCLGLEKEKIIYYINVIKKLNPKPGLVYRESSSQYIFPDAVILFDKIKDEIKVEIMDKRIPNLKINKMYVDILANGDTLEREFVKDKIKKAFALIKAIENRKNTIEKIFSYIAKEQKEYLFKNGLQKTIYLSDIAKVTNLHESTISRTVNNKYVQTPKGIMLAKDLLSRGISQEDDRISVEYIKRLIKEIITNEDKRRPYSDVQISDLLLEKGIKISRRTVTKYREEMNILPSNLRKLDKNVK